MNYAFLLVTHEGPRLMTYEQFEAFIDQFNNELTTITELVEGEVFDYETLLPNQGVFLAISSVKIHPETKSWSF